MEIPGHTAIGTTTTMAATTVASTITATIIDRLRTGDTTGIILAQDFLSEVEVRDCTLDFE